ncbi:hypothetical protein BG003_008776, partial [Podila horticola]
TMADIHHTLFCLVDGEATSNAFPIEIMPTKTIGHLKDLIKVKKPNDFRDIDANNLTLWRVTIPIRAENNHEIISLVSLGRGV